MYEYLSAEESDSFFEYSNILHCLPPMADTSSSSNDSPRNAEATGPESGMPENRL